MIILLRSSDILISGLADEQMIDVARILRTSDINFFKIIILWYKWKEFMDIV